MSEKRLAMTIVAVQLVTGAPAAARPARALRARLRSDPGVEEDREQPEHVRHHRHEHRPDALGAGRIQRMRIQAEQSAPKKVLVAVGEGLLEGERRETVVASWRHLAKEVLPTMLKLSIATVSVAALLVSFSALAQARPAPHGVVQLGGSLDDAEAWEAVQKEIDAKAAKSSQACDTKITAGIDVPSFAGVDLAKSPVQSYGRDAVASLENVCRTPAGKKAVQSQIKRVTLRRGRSGTQVALAAGELVVYIDPDNTSISGKKPGSYSWLSAVREVL